LKQYPLVSDGQFRRHVVNDLTAVLINQSSSLSRNLFYLDSLPLFWL
jgi:hypothetical protein